MTRDGSIKNKLTTFLHIILLKILFTENGILYAAILKKCRDM